MKAKIEYFKINKLWGTTNVKLKFKNNRLVLIGENGSGKTTILRIVYETLACDWASLSEESFESIEVKFSGTENIKIKKGELLKKDEELKEINYDILRELPIKYRNILLSSKDANGKQISFSDVIKKIKQDHYVDDDVADLLEYRASLINKNSIKSKTKLIKDLLGCEIQYWPTYRRIEQELPNRNYEYKDRIVFRNRNLRNRAYGELNNKNIISKTGMNDIKIAIDKCIEEIEQEAKETADELNIQFFKDVINRNIFNVDLNTEYLTKNEIDKVFNSIGDKQLNKKEKKRILDELIKIKPSKNSDDIDYTNISYYLYYKLRERFQKIKEKEQVIKRLFEACNNYLRNKALIYNESDYSYSIKMKESSKVIDIENLSSGEKQVVSMFTYLYLNYEKDTFILIDEPELSLSVPWQEKLLTDISNSPHCAGLFAVTHSPFIFNNDLEDATFALNDFEE